MPKSLGLKAAERDPNWRSKCHAQRHKTLELRIAEKAVRDPGTGCLNWIGAADGDGYGLITINGKLTRVTRHVLANEIGRSLSDEEVACHSCDNPACIAEEHLWLGSGSANQVDSVLKGRHPHTRLKADDVRTIRRLVANGSSQAAMCRKFGISDGHICQIIHRKKWKHLPDEEVAR